MCFWLSCYVGQESHVALAFQADPNWTQSSLCSFYVPIKLVSLEPPRNLRHKFLCRGSPRIAAEVSVGKDGRDAERVTTTLSRRQKAELDRLAETEGVKVAWLVRRAVEQLLEQKAGGPMLPLD